MARRPVFFSALFLFALAGASMPVATASPRLPLALLEVTAPSARISGAPGSMQIVERGCRMQADASLRERIVLTAIQEWAFFGYSLYDLTASAGNDSPYRRRGRTPIAADEALRVAASIGGYWSATPNSDWILAEQNQSWQRFGADSRWRNPWSAAFISWIMCEAGLGESERFARAVAHHAYIDQAISARDRGDPQAAYHAFDSGETRVEPGDMLCRGSRPDYRTIAQRRAQLGEGARTHCDIVVKVDADNARFLVIGGNVRGWVRLKLLPGAVDSTGKLVPAPFSGRRIFAHLKLQAGSVPAGYFDASLRRGMASCSTTLAALEAARIVSGQHCS
ncbi:MAG: DUF2272 domain-containing protein [Pseudohongiellaceae bacterium]